MEIVLFAAFGKNRELGFDNQLLWHLPGDLPRFKQMTMGHPIIMGRKTFDSIGKPLPGRHNIVITRQEDWQQADVTAVTSPDAALDAAKPGETVYIIGGEQIYTLFLPLATRLEITEVHAVAEKADAFFPNYSDMGFTEIQRTPNQHNDLQYDYVTLVRDP